MRYFVTKFHVKSIFRFLFCIVLQKQLLENNDLVKDLKGFGLSYLADNSHSNQTQGSVFIFFLNFNSRFTNRLALFIVPYITLLFHAFCKDKGL